jgi:hypothetical protein
MLRGSRDSRFALIPGYGEADARGAVPLRRGFRDSRFALIPGYRSVFIQLKPAEVPASGRYSQPTQPR